MRNDFNVLCRMQQYPWEALGGATPMPPELLERMRKGFWRDAWWSSLWVGWAELHHASREQGLAERKIIEEALARQGRPARVRRRSGGSVLPLGRRRRQGSGRPVLRPGWPGGRRGPRRPGRREYPQRLLEEEDPRSRTIWTRTATAAGSCSAYPPCRSRAGTSRAALDIVKETLSRYAFEPILIVGCISERVVYINVDITYDREVEGEDERALECHDEMLGRLIESGYVPYRLGIQSVRLLPEPDDDTGKLLDALKKTLDPNNILAPGRYGLGTGDTSREEADAREQG